MRLRTLQEREPAPPDLFLQGDDPAGLAEQFGSWLARVLGVLFVSSLARSRLDAWYSAPVVASYRQALRQVRVGGRRLTSAEVAAAMESRVHRQTLRTLARVGLGEMKGISSAVQERMEAALLDGLTRRLPVQEIARRVGAIPDGFRNRGEIAAHQAIIRAQSEARLNIFEERGAGLVTIVTHPDRCPECAALEGLIFSVNEARGMIPVHPRCRCTWAEA